MLGFFGRLLRVHNVLSIPSLSHVRGLNIACHRVVSDCSSQNGSIGCASDRYGYPAWPRHAGSLNPSQNVTARAVGWLRFPADESRACQVHARRRSIHVPSGRRGQVHDVAVRLALDLCPGARTSSPHSTAFTADPQVAVGCDCDAVERRPSESVADGARTCA